MRPHITALLNRRYNVYQQSMLQTCRNLNSMGIIAISPSSNHNLTVITLHHNRMSVHFLGIHIRICGEITTDILSAHGLANSKFLLIALVNDFNHIGFYRANYRGIHPIWHIGRKLHGKSSYLSRFFHCFAGDKRIFNLN